MQETFIKSIDIFKVRHLEDLTIEISDNSRKHLVITGMNGSGKTSLLQSIQGALIPDKLSSIDSLMQEVIDEENGVSTDDQIRYDASYSSIKTDDLSIEFIGDRRTTINVSYGVNRKLIVQKSDGGKDDVFKQVSHFEKFLAKKRTEQAFLSFEKGNETKVNEITNWFGHLEQNLRYLFETQDLFLTSKREEDKVKFLLSMKGREDFDFNTLSDGYSSILYILFEIIMKMDNDVNTNYNKEGIVLIDEIESHLHVSLQKKILPFLTKFFPRIQFIVTTHSPFVLQSEPNAVIYDLEKKKRFEDFSHYSSENILETYFGIDKFSQALKNDMEKYVGLLQDEKILDANKIEILKMRSEFQEIPDTEFSLWLKQTELKNLKILKEVLND